MSAQVVRCLLYHDVVASGEKLATSGFSGSDSNFYKLDESVFADHLDAVSVWSRSSDAQGASVGQLLNLRSKAQAQVIFTFDDAGASSLRIADFLEEKGWRGHFFAPTKFIGEKTFLDRQGLRDLARRGHQLGSHSVTHPLRMADLPYDMIRAEWRDSLAALSDVIGEGISSASVPGGMYSARVRQAAEEAGVKLLFTSEPRQRLQTTMPMTVCGRFSIVRNSATTEALEVARGARAALIKRRVFWDSKKVAKILIGRRFLDLRRFWFNRRSGL